MGQYTLNDTLTLQHIQGLFQEALDRLKEALAQLQSCPGNGLDRSYLANVGTRVRELEELVARHLSLAATSGHVPRQSEPPLLLEAERRAFLQRKEQLLASHRGQYVALIGASVVASAPDPLQVIQEASKKVGKRPMLVEQVLEDRFKTEPDVVEMSTPITD